MASPAPLSHTLPHLRLYPVILLIGQRISSELGVGAYARNVIKEQHGDKFRVGRERI